MAHHHRDRADPRADATGRPDPAGSMSPALDEAYDRMATSDFELPNGFVNHGPMACEALAILGCDDRIDAWARRSVAATGEGPAPVSPAGGTFDWQDALGRYDRLPEWLGYFDAAIADAGWPAVVVDWVPRLMPALSTALFHGAIRTAHAVRAVAATDTAARRSELARALGYWAARYRAGRPATGPVSTTAVAQAIGAAATAEAAVGSHHYLAAPNIFNLHGVTGAMAVELLASHLAPEDGAAALAQVRVEHAAMYAGTGARGVAADTGWDPAVVERAAASGDPHQVKLVEACRRGLGLNGDPVFAAAAETVTGRG